MRSTQVIQAVTPSNGSKRQSRVFGHRLYVKTQLRQSSAKGSLGSQLTISHRVRYRHVCATVIAPDVQTKRSVAEKLAWVQTTNMVSLCCFKALPCKDEMHWCKHMQAMLSHLCRQC